VSTELSSPSSLASRLRGGAVLRQFVPSWPWLLGFAAMLRALASPQALLDDPDIYLHITAGNWMLAHRALPTADPFSHTMPGARWIPSEWLAETVFAAVYGVAGWGGVVVLAAAAFGLAVGLLAWFLSRRLPPLPAAVAALAGATLVLPHLLARPHMLALPILVIWCGALLGARDEGGGPPWRILPVMVLWANLHGSFMFGLALAGFAGSEAALYPATGASAGLEIRRWAGFLASATLAALCTPNELGGFLQPLRLVFMPALQTGFVEWLPPNLAHFPALEAWLLGAVALGFGFGVRMPWMRLALLLVLFAMTLAHVRHADLLGLVGPLAVAAALAAPFTSLLAPAAGSPLSRLAAALAVPSRLPAVVLALGLGVAASLPVLLHPPVRADDAVTPTAALAAAERLHLTGPLFHTEAYGGYLIFVGVPVFIDGRIEMYGDDFLREYLFAERGDPATLDKLLDRYHVTWTLLRSGTPAIGTMDHKPGWHRAWSDERSVIHVPDG
jgi:hypothetical protein